MKDSQQYVNSLVATESISKANNERFSTSFELVGNVQKYIKGE